MILTALRSSVRGYTWILRMCGKGCKVLPGTPRLILFFARCSFVVACGVVYCLLFRES